MRNERLKWAILHVAALSQKIMFWYKNTQAMPMYGGLKFFQMDTIQNSQRFQNSLRLLEDVVLCKLCEHVKSLFINVTDIS